MHFCNSNNTFIGFARTTLLPGAPNLGKGEVMLGTRLPGPPRPPIPKIHSFPPFQHSKMNSTVMFMVNLKSSTR